MASNDVKSRNFTGYFLLLACLVGVFAVLFHKSFEPNYVHFANDGPYGAMMEDRMDVLRAVRGFWQPRNWIGEEIVIPQLSIEVGVWAAFGRLIFAKFMVPFSLTILGSCAWLFFRQLGLNPAVCLLAGLASALNMNFFSNACWGQNSRPLTLATSFLAAAALVSATKNRYWIKSILAGFALGWGIYHGFDVGALFSVLIAAFAVFLDLFAPKPLPVKLGKSAVRVAVMACFAGLLATHVVVSLVNTQIKGVVGLQQDAQSKRERWDQYTQWSTPKMEALRVIIPGLFGYRMDTRDGGQYWGRVGQPENVPTFRFSGSGEYAGVFVVLISTFAITQAFRRKNSSLSAIEQKSIWFWGVVALVTLLLAFGRYAPFYQLFYALPYASTIRNPMKFMHLFHMALLILFGYGLDVIWRQFVIPSLPKASSMKDQISRWWMSARSIDKTWFIYGCCGTVLVSVLGFLLYTSSRKELESYIERAGFGRDPQLARNLQMPALTASFSYHEVALYLLFLLLSVALIALLLSGWFSGTRAKWAGILIGTLLIVDLGRANMPWIVYWNYKYKYESNPIVDILRDKPYEHRTAFAPFPIPQMEQFRQGVYGIEWHQQLYPYYDIQCLDVIQSPRISIEDSKFKQNFPGVAGLLRQWELTNTRLILGPNSEIVDALNQQIDPTQKRFRLHTAFDIVPKPGATVRDYTDFTAAVNPHGKLGLAEFTGALPRAKLYGTWQTTNDDATLQKLASSDFNPHDAVIVSDTTPVAPATNSSGSDVGTVDITSYAAQKIELKAHATSKCVLLFNDRFNPKWKVSVDGKPATMLRCNYVMRGVSLEPGDHTIVFTFEPPAGTLYITSAAALLAIALCGFCCFRRPSGQESKEPTEIKV